MRDVAEIQTLPYNPNAHIQQVQEVMSNPVSCEEDWRNGCLRGILSYPPGTQRLLVMDAMRGELVQKLSQSLQKADRTLKLYENARRRAGAETMDLTGQGDPFLDADVEILRAFKEETFVDPNADHEKDPDEEPVLAISNNRTSDSDKSTTSSGSRSSEPSLVQEDDTLPSTNEVEDAQKTIRTVREYLPQLVSVVLRSPPAFEPNLLDPIEKLRRVIVKRCVEDANWGVDMCWLLEADVGRAWKTLFEHRQQTGRRLIVVLPAEKAAVLAKIGTGKKEAFDLLQDAEQATAYGYTTSLDEYLYNSPQQQTMYQEAQSPHGHTYHGSRDYSDHSSSRLPSSLSLRRCSHFGDTMHFIDRLTKISLEMRRVPPIHREKYLQESLKEMNRRLRRRMVTRGDVSLDVEDNCGPEDWPRIQDISKDMLEHSVHLPLDPKQQRRWPGGDYHSGISDGGVVRVLNIVVEECRMLSSRERCPYLVHVEVAETGLNGNDSRLYASGASGIGATVEEALSMSADATSAAGANGHHVLDQGRATYQIPSELLAPSSNVKIPTAEAPSLEASREDDEEDNAPEHNKEAMRGGWQSDETVFYSHQPEDVFLASNPYDAVRQNEYEQLHEQLHAKEGVMAEPQHIPGQRDPMVSTREALLDQVFGQQWAEKCEEIRQASPYGKTEGWRLASFIMKAGEDIRREALVMQIISKLNEWFELEIPEANRPHMRPYTIMCVGGDAGLVECLSDAKSIDEVKKRTDNFESLRDYFERAYGPPTTHSVHYQNSQTGRVPAKTKALSFEQAQDNFLRSLVGYSLVCYILQIKDRHNANILLDREGNIMHIDFGFVLGDTPKMSKLPVFNERAPFKLSNEFWDVLGGWNVNRGGLGVRFCNMFEGAFASASSHTEEIVSIVEATMLTLTESPRQARILANGVRARLRMRGAPGSIEQKTFIMELMNAALTSWGTSTYDWLQKSMNGYQ